MILFHEHHGRQCCIGAIPFVVVLFLLFRVVVCPSVSVSICDPVCRTARGIVPSMIVCDLTEYWLVSCVCLCAEAQKMPLQ